MEYGAVEQPASAPAEESASVPSVLDLRKTLANLSYTIIFYIHARDGSVVRLVASCLTQFVLTQAQLLKIHMLSPVVAGLRVYVLMLALNNSMGHYINSLTPVTNPGSYSWEGILGQFVGEMRRNSFPTLLTLDVVLLALQMFYTAPARDAPGRIVLDI